MSLKDPSLVSLFPGELETLVFNKLSKANILIFSKKEIDQTINTESLVKIFEDEILARNIVTVVNIGKYLYDPLRELLPKNLPDNCPPEYLFLFHLITAYLQGTMIGIQGHEEIKKKPQHFDQVTKLFSEEEFEQMEDASEALVAQVLKEIEGCKTDFNRDRSGAEKVKNTVMDFMKAIHDPQYKNNFVELLDLFRGKIELRTLMDTHMENRREQWFGSPCERLLLSLEKLLMYWEVLHNAGRVNTSPSKDPFLS